MANAFAKVLHSALINPTGRRLAPRAATSQARIAEAGKIQNYRRKKKKKNSLESTEVKQSLPSGTRGGHTAQGQPANHNPLLSGWLLLQTPCPSGGERMDPALRRWLVLHEVIIRMGKPQPPEEGFAGRLRGTGTVWRNCALSQGSRCRAGTRCSSGRTAQFRRWPGGNSWTRRCNIAAQKAHVI